MRVGHQITRAFPTANVSGRNRPGRTGQVVMAGEKFEINRCAEEGVTLHPFLDLAELLDRHFAREEEIFRPQIQPLDHVLLGRVVLVAGRNSVAVHAEIGEIIEHLFDLFHISLLVDRRIGSDLIAQNLRHLDRENAFFENAFALDNQIVNPLEAIEVDIPIHPHARPNGGLVWIFWTLANFGRVFVSNQTGRNQFADFVLHELWLGRQLRGHPFAHFLAHEHRVGADVNDALLLEQPLHERLDMRINQRFAAANGDHRRVAFLGRAQTILQTHHVLKRR